MHYNHGVHSFDAKWIAYHRCRMLVRSLWPRAQANLYGSFVTGLGLPWSDLDLVIWLPKVSSAYYCYR
jgi:DNA polymerase sigma